MPFMNPKHTLRDIISDDGARGCYNTSRNRYDNAPDIFHKLMAVNIDTITHKEQLQLTLKILRHEIEFQQNLMNHIEAPDDLSALKTMLWHITKGKQKKRACKKEVKKAREYIYDIEYVLSLMHSCEYIEDAYAYYNEIADKEHAISDQWRYGSTVNQAHIREGNKARHYANTLVNGYKLTLELYLQYFKVLSNRICY
ncbi:MAG: hypothetical protein CFH43_00386 [Proteobacteria bacterium]|nr:MAG: hypothetical protein CFH43_00386 [Pseudomonadota bacterium]